MKPKLYSSRVSQAVTKARRPSKNATATHTATTATRIAAGDEMTKGRGFCWTSIEVVIGNGSKRIGTGSLVSTTLEAAQAAQCNQLVLRECDHSVLGAQLAPFRHHGNVMRRG
jgi:hypothetical protein